MCFGPSWLLKELHELADGVLNRKSETEQNDLKVSTLQSIDCG